MTNDSAILREVLQAKKLERDALKARATLMRTLAAIIFAVAVATEALIWWQG